jgi:hypothetical protein
MKKIKEHLMQLRPVRIWFFYLLCIATFLTIGVALATIHLGKSLAEANFKSKVQQLNKVAMFQYGTTNQTRYLYFLDEKGQVVQEEEVVGKILTNLRLEQVHYVDPVMVFERVLKEGNPLCERLFVKWISPKGEEKILNGTNSWSAVMLTNSKWKKRKG